MKIRIFSLFLALCMLCSMLPYPAWAAEETDLSIVSIDVEDVTIIQNTDGYEVTIYDDETWEEIGTYYHYWYYPDFAVTMSDGSVYQGEAGWIEIDGVSYDLAYTDDQGAQSPWDVGPHEVTATLGQVQATFTVTIQESPVEWIAVEPLIMYEGTNGWMDSYWDADRAQWVENTWYHYDIFPQAITVCYKDGTTLTGSKYTIEEQTGHYVSYYDPQDYTAQWGVGEHTATAMYMGVTCDYQVVIQESPVERIEVEPLTLYEGKDGWMDSYWDVNQEEWVENAWFRYDTTPQTITVYYKDGTSLTGRGYEIEEQTGYSVNHSDSQNYTAQWSAGEHTATAEYIGVTCDYQVTILENPVERIEVAPITLQEGVNGSMNGYWDEELEEWVDNTWFWYDISPQNITVYYKDGTSLTGSLFEIEEQTGYYVSYSDPQDYTAPWGPGTYTATAEYMGITCQYQITIVENAVERIEAESVTLLEGTHGSWYSSWDEAQQTWISDTWYHYDTSPEKLTIYYKDGTSFSGYMYEILEQTGAYPSVYDNQNEFAPWGPGVHTATVQFMGRTCEFQVTIQENNVARIEASPVVLLEGVDGDWNGYWDDDSGEWIADGWFRYDSRPQQITVYYKDGTSQTGSVDNMEDQEGGYVTSSDDQDYAAQWGPGTYTANAQFMGRTCQYQVTIQENNVADIEIAPLTLYEGVNGDQRDGWFEYDTRPKTITVYYKDGTSETCSVSDIVARMGVDLSVSDNQSKYAPWGLGTHTATARFMGRTCEFQVNVLENPIASVSLIRMPEKTVYRVAERIDLKGAVLRVAFTDGTWEDIQIDRSTAYMMAYYKQYRLSKLDIESNLALSERGFYSPGTYTIELQFAGQICDFTVEVQESTISGITIQSPDGEQLQIVATHEDGTTEQFNVLWLEDNIGDGTEEYVMVGGNIPTDQGTFYGQFYQMADGSMYLSASMGPGGTRLRSNTLYGCSWPGNWERIQDYIYSLAALNGSGDSFTGEVNADNIDELIEIIRCYDGWYKSFYTDGITLNGTLDGRDFIYAGADIRAALKTMFAIEDADLSLSSRYDPDTDTYAVQGEGWGSSPFEIPPEFEEKDGLLQVTVTLESGTKLRMMLDDAYRIIAYYLFDGEHDHDYENSRCTICGAVYSGKLQIVKQPVDYVGLVGDTATFTVVADGEGLKYQWYFSKDGGTTWEKTSSTGNTISVEFKAYRNDYLYRCEITDANGNIVISNSAGLIARKVALAIISQPESFVGAVNDEVTFTVAATGNGLVYAWFFSNDGGRTWVRSYSPGYQTNTLSPVLRAHRDGNLYRCVVTDVFGNSVTSDVVSMSVKASDVVITAQPQNVENAILGQLYQFTVTAEGDNLTYRWQVSTDGGVSWTESWNQGYNSATLNVRMNANRDGNLYRCVVTSGLKTVEISDAAVLDMQDPSAKIISQSGNVAVIANQTAAFTVEAEGTDLTYQWYRSNDKGTTWNQTYLSGYNTDTLRFAATTARAAMYMCKVTDGSGKVVWSEPVKLTILSAELKILTQPSDVTCASGATATFTVEAQGDTLKYQWYASTDDGATWTASYLTGYNTNALRFTVNAARAAKLYKCVITDVVGSTVETNTVKVTIG